MRVKGIYGDTIEGLPPQPDFSGFQDPLPLSNSNTKFTLDAQALNLYEYELADNHNVEHDEGTEQNQVFIESWSEEGKFIIESPRCQLEPLRLNANFNTCSIYIHPWRSQWRSV